MELTFEELQQLEYLLKKFHEVDVYPYNGVTSQKWQNDVIVAMEDSKKKQVVRRKHGQVGARDNYKF